MDTQPVCDIVIVNWNSGSDLQSCLDALGQVQQDFFDLGMVVVVDNASNDLSAEVEFPAGILCKLIKNRANRGFAVACNQGATYCSGSHILFLNPDVVTSRNCIDELFSWLTSNPKHAGAIASVALKTETGDTACTCSRFPSVRTVVGKVFGVEKLLSKYGWSQPMWDFDHKTTRVVDQVIGAFFLVPKPLFDRAHGFSENYFLYYEEVDFCFRARALGSHCVFYAETYAYHAGGGASKNIPVTRLKLNLQSRLKYCKQHFAWHEYYFSVFLTLLIEPITRIFAATCKGQPRIIGHTIAAYALLHSQILQRRE